MASSSSHGQQRRPPRTHDHDARRCATGALWFVAACCGAALCYLWPRAASVPPASLSKGSAGDTTASVPVSVLDSTAAATLSKYAVARWEDTSLGNHRVRLRLSGPPPGAPDRFVYARIEWRLPGLPMERQRNPVLVSEASRTSRAVHVLSSTSEAIELLFEAGDRDAPGTPGSTYLLYYLPYAAHACETGPASSCRSPYGTRLFAQRAHARWRNKAAALAKHAAPGWEKTLSTAEPIAFEARTERDSFYPMEVAATTAEAAAVRAVAAHGGGGGGGGGGRPVVVWAEERTRPIRMSKQLPLAWLASGVPAAGGTKVVGHAHRGEFFAFQLGVYATRATTLRPAWSGLERRGGGAALHPSTLRCINAPNGSAASEEGLPLQEGEVLALWFGLEVPLGAQPGTYAGSVTLKLQDGGGGGGGSFLEVIPLEISISDSAIEQHGDGELWRHSRLRWLDSRVGETLPAQVTAQQSRAAVRRKAAAALGGSALPAPAGGADHGRPDVWQPISIERESRTLTAFGRRVVRLSAHGLPSQLSVGSTQLLTAPMSLVLLHATAGPLLWEPFAPVELAATATGGASWRVRGEVRGASPACAHMQVRRDRGFHSNHIL